MDGRAVIPGRHDARDVYSRLAQRHRPTDGPGIVAAARDMASRGFKPAEISYRLGIALPAVLVALGEPSGQVVPSAGGSRGG